MTRTIALSLCLIALGLLAAAPAAAGKPGDPGSVQFRGASFPVAEEAGEVTIVVKRHGGSTGSVTVDYATVGGSAVAGEDFEEVTGTLEWGNGDRADKSFTVPILDDDLNEGQETFGVVLSNPAGGVELGAVGSAVVRIKPSDRGGDDGGGGGDDDEAGVIRLTAVAFPAFESSGEATFVVERDGGSVGAVTVDYATIDASALAGEDYLTTAGTLTWEDGESGQKVVTVALIDDEESEDLETITVVLTLATGGAELGMPNTGSIIVLDDDGGAGSCVPDDETLCLGDGRFQITGTWRDFDGNEGPFHAIPASDDSGLFWFFEAANVEVLLKVLDGCPLNGHYWVFFAGMTNLGFTLEVTDLEADETRVYENPVGVVPLAITDVTAFSGCP